MVEVHCIYLTLNTLFHMEPIVSTTLLLPSKRVNWYYFYMCLVLRSQGIKPEIVHSKQTLVRPISLKTQECFLLAQLDPDTF